MPGTLRQVSVPLLQTNLHQPPLSIHVALFQLRIDMAEHCLRLISSSPKLHGFPLFKLIDNAEHFELGNLLNSLKKLSNTLSPWDVAYYQIPNFPHQGAVDFN